MKLLREPLLHFLAARRAPVRRVYGFAGRRRAATPSEIVVSAGQIASMAAIFAHLAAPADRRGARRAGRRLRPRRGLLPRGGGDGARPRRRGRPPAPAAEDGVPRRGRADAEPTDAELKAYLAEHAERFRSEPRFSFRHVYFAATRRRAARGDRAAAAQARTAGDDGRVDRSATRSCSATISTTLARSTSRRPSASDSPQALGELPAATGSGPVDLGLRPASRARRASASKRREPPLERRPRRRAARMAARPARSPPTRRSTRSFDRRYVVTVETVAAAVETARDRGAMIRLLAAFASCSLVAGHAQAHDLRPGLPRDHRDRARDLRVLWKVPAMGELRLALYPRLPERGRPSRAGAILGDAYVERWTRAACPAG